MNTSTQLSGTVRRVTYQNTETGFFVARVLVGGKDERTVVGYSPTIAEGERLTATGCWEHKNHGVQFKAVSVSFELPQELTGIERFLASSVEGIGAGLAGKLVAEFGTRVFSVIENEPQRLASVPGIGPKRAASIVDAYNASKAVRDIMVFLHRHGLSAARARRVYALFGRDAVQRLSSNPFELMSVWGVGFHTADRFAASLGVARTSEFRVRAGVQHVLQEAESEGSCGLPQDAVIARSCELLQVDRSRVLDAVDALAAAGEVVRDKIGAEDCLFLPGVYRAERSIAKFLLSHVARQAEAVTPEMQQRVVEAEMDLGLSLEPQQSQAVLRALTEPVTVVTGGPGSGKTTLTRVLLRVLRQRDERVVFAAPTGKAAKRAAEATGAEVTTIHRMLEVDHTGSFRRNETNKLDADVVIIDEMSMVDVRLFAAVLRAVPRQARLVLVGDADQLPSVGPGRVLADIIASEAVPTTRLSRVFRQAVGSRIIDAAHAVNCGQMPAAGTNGDADFRLVLYEKRGVSVDIEQALLAQVAQLWKLGFDPVRDVQVLTPTRRGILGSVALNQKLRKLLNPHPSATLGTGDSEIGVGDRVIQLRNDYTRDVFNGDIGYVTAIDRASGTFAVEFDGRSVTYRASELDDVALAYCLTVHKSQGSEFPVVLMPLDFSHYKMLRRNLVYTGITRARRLMMLFCQRPALTSALSNSQTEQRFSRLKEWLVAGRSPAASSLAAEAVAETAQAAAS
jgi:exodeoxyribonuclease V alpha subunit